MSLKKKYFRKLYMCVLPHYVIILPVMILVVLHENEWKDILFETILMIIT